MVTATDESKLGPGETQAHSALPRLTPKHLYELGVVHVAITVGICLCNQRTNLSLSIR
jgi:hypothetical protein